MKLSRRNLLVGLVAAPAIVKIQSLMIMPRRPWPPLIASDGLLLYHDGLLKCNGALARKEDFPELFALMGTTWGGDGVDTFRLPNMEPMPFLGERMLGHAVNVKPENGPIGMIVFTGAFG
jgi:hypothetical protein